MKKYSLVYNIKEWEQNFPQKVWKEFFTLAELNAYAKKKSAGSLVARYLLKKEIISLGLINDFLKIEILNEDNGTPILTIDGLSDSKISNINFSISHSKTDVAVLIVVEK